MDKQLLVEKFERMGARVKVTESADRTGVRIDIQKDRHGEFFDVRVGREMSADAIDLRARQRHLLLAVREEDPRLHVPTGSAQRFLCGHDERSWFVAAVPEGRAASNVDQAMDALKPTAVRQAMAHFELPFSHRHRRKTAAFKRQGEWFFVPVDGPVPEAGEITRNERLARTGGKAHIAEFARRFGGEQVYVNWRTPQAISRWEYQRLVSRDAGAGKNYYQQLRNASVMVKGRISHPDHKTILLRDWHFVYMNTENQSRAMRSVAFID
jgi:hypothetical protein